VALQFPISLTIFVVSGEGAWLPAMLPDHRHPQAWLWGQFPMLAKSKIDKYALRVLVMLYPNKL